MPNTGKSTLLNRLVGEKLSIVTPKAQTTRQRLRGIDSGDGYQIVFVDTPGLLEPRYPLQEAMLEEAEAAMADTDVVVLVADAGYERSLVHARAFAAPRGVPALLCLNKIDRVDEDEARALEERFRASGWEEVRPTVATTGVGIGSLRDAIVSRLPESPPLYDTDELSTAPLRFLAAELIRETVFETLAEEVPYATAVSVDEFREPEDSERPVYISAVVYVERPSQKGIVIGSGGKAIRRIGTLSREKIEALLQARVYLDLRVKVLRNWRKRQEALRQLGYRGAGPG